MQRAYELECNCICPPYTSLDITDFDLRGSSFNYKGYDYKINLGGTHQVANALTAIETVSYLSALISRPRILKTVLKEQEYRLEWSRFLTE